MRCDRICRRCPRQTKAEDYVTTRKHSLPFSRADYSDCLPDPDKPLFFQFRKKALSSVFLWSKVFHRTPSRLGTDGQNKSDLAQDPKLLMFSHARGAKIKLPITVVYLISHQRDGKCTWGLKHCRHEGTGVSEGADRYNSAAPDQARW